MLRLGLVIAGISLSTGAQASVVRFNWVPTGADPMVINPFGTIEVDSALAQGGQIEARGNACPYFIPSGGGLLQLEFGFSGFRYDVSRLDRRSLNNNDQFCLRLVDPQNYDDYLSGSKNGGGVDPGWSMTIEFENYSVKSLNAVFFASLDAARMTATTMERFIDYGSNGLDPLVCQDTRCVVPGLWQVDASAVPVPEPYGLQWLLIPLAILVGRHRRAEPQG